MNKSLLFALGFAVTGLLRADGLAGGQDLTGTVKVSGIEISNNQLIVGPKEKYVHILWNAFPYRSAIKGAGKSFSLETAAADLAKGPGMLADSKAKLIKVDVVEFPERDDYGAPLWNKVKFLGRFAATKQGKKWVISKRAK